MAVEDRYIPTQERTTVDGNEIEIFIFYQEEGAMNLIFFVPNSDTTREGIPFIGGDLGYTYENISAIFEINTLGELIVNDIDPTIYSIDVNGDLILTTT